MTKLLTTTALALLLGLGSALAAEDTGQAGENGQPPTESSVTPDTAKEAKVPDQGKPDTSGGAQERSSAPPNSGAVMGEDTDSGKSSMADEPSDADASTE